MSVAKLTQSELLYTFLRSFRITPLVRVGSSCCSNTQVTLFDCAALSFHTRSVCVHCVCVGGKLSTSVDIQCLFVRLCVCVSFMWVCVCVQVADLNLCWVYSSKNSHMFLSTQNFNSTSAPQVRGVTGSYGSYQCATSFYAAPINIFTFTHDQLLEFARMQPPLPSLCVFSFWTDAAFRHILDICCSWNAKWKELPLPILVLMPGPHL